jgi:hypothetical protein
MKKRESNPSPPTQAAPPPEPPASAAPLPKTLADIPNLGPIRLRALQKAGYHDLRELKTAPLSVLAAVPGMSEIKAKQLTDYLSQFPELPDMPLASAPAVKRTRPDHSQRPDLQLTAKAAKILGEMSHVLLRTPATERRSRLSRQFEVMEEVLMPFIGVIPYVAPERLPELENRFNDTLAAFRATRQMDKFSKKAQGELADTLETFHAALFSLAAETKTPETETPAQMQETP